MKKLGIIASVLCLSTAAFAVEPGMPMVPGSAQPGVIDRTLQTAPLPTSYPGQPSVVEQQRGAEALGPQAKKIKFKLKKLIIKGNTKYSRKDLLPLYKNKLNTMITVAELMDIIDSITHFYRNNGYITSQAMLPPQQIKNGIVIVVIYEGYLDKVNVEGDPGKTRSLIQTYGNKIASSRPLDVRRLERYLLLANEIPGVTVQSILVPSKTNFAASTINLVAKRQLINGYLSYDNYQSRYVGPNEVSAGLQFNSIIRGGDSTNFGYVTSSRPKQLHFVSASHSTPLGTEGATITGGGYISYSRPGLILAPLQINSEADYYYGLIKYPAIRSIEKSLTFTGGFDYYDSWQTAITGSLYGDHLRSIKVGAQYNFSDKLRGNNLITSELKQGMCIMGAVCNAQSVTTSRYGGQGGFTKLTAQVTRLQPLLGPLSAFLLIQGQYSFVPLLVSEQYAFGGPFVGRAYDPGEIIGDRGAGASGELRMDTATPWAYLSTLQTYIFYDIGKIWNMRNISSTPQAQSAASTGVGLRCMFSKYISGNFTLAQPVTKAIASNQISGSNGGHKPRGLFSLTVSM